GRLPPRLRASDDPDGDRHAESGHPVKNVTSNLRLGSLIGQNPGVKAPADDGLVSIHCGFGQAPAIVAWTALPTDAPMLGDGRKMSVALCWDGSAGNSRRSGRDNDRGLGVAFGNSMVNGFAIIRAVCGQRINLNLDLIE